MLSKLCSPVVGPGRDAAIGETLYGTCFDMKRRSGKAVSSLIVPDGILMINTGNRSQR